MAAANKLLGQFDLVGIPPAPRGVPKIEVTFDIDANGIVHVSARDKTTGKEQSIAIQSSGGLSEEQIQNMVREAEQHAAEDKRLKDIAHARNDAESLLHSTDKSLEEYTAKLPADLQSEIRAAMTELRDAVGKDDVEVLKEKTTALSNASMKIGEALNKAGGSGGDSQQSQSEQSEGGEKK